MVDEEGENRVCVANGGGLMGGGLFECVIRHHSDNNTRVMTERDTERERERTEEEVPIAIVHDHAAAATWASLPLSGLASSGVEQLSRSLQCFAIRPPVAAGLWSKSARWRRLNGLRVVPLLAFIPSLPSSVPPGEATLHAACCGMPQRDSLCRRHLHPGN